MVYEKARIGIIVNGAVQTFKLLAESFKESDAGVAAIMMRLRDTASQAQQGEEERTLVPLDAESMFS